MSTPFTIFSLSTFHFSLRAASATRSSDAHIDAEAYLQAVTKAVGATCIYRISTAVVSRGARAELLACGAIFIVFGIAFASHIKASALGATISATATLTAVDGRSLTFTIVASEGDKTIGEGTHTRFIVDRERFLSKLK